MASDKLMNHTQGETIITKLTAIADSLDDLAAVTPAKLGMGIATCDTAASTAAKTAALANFALVEGAPVSVQFTYANTATNATLNINNTGAKPIIYKDAAIGNDVISAGDTCTFIYTTNTYKITNIDTLTGPGSGTVRQVGAENGLITDQTDNADIQTTGNIGLNLKSTTAFSTEVGAHNTSTDNMYPVALDSEGHPVAAVPNGSTTAKGTVQLTDSVGTSSGASTTDVPTEKAVAEAIESIGKPMVWTGTITLTADSTDTTKCSIAVSKPASANDIKNGYTYRIGSIASSPVYTGPYKVGDTFIASKDKPDVTANWVVGTDWDYTPSGDEPSGTVTGVKMTSAGTTIDPDGNGVVTLTEFVGSGTGHKSGLVPDPGSTAGTKKYLVEDGTWKAPDSTFESTPTDNTIPSSKLVKDSLDTKVVGPSSVTGDTIVLFDSTTGKLVKSSSKTFESLYSISDDDTKIPTSKGIRENAATYGKLGTYSADTSRTNITNTTTIKGAVKQLEYREELNKSNILYAINTGVKNIAFLKNGTYQSNAGGSESTFVVENGVVTVTSITAGTRVAIMNYVTLPAGTYIITNRQEDGYDVRLRYNDVDYNNTFTINSATTFEVRAYTYKVVTNVTVTPLLCVKSVYDQDSSYQPPALPNYDLTRGLAELNAHPFLTVPINHNMIYRGQNLGDTLTADQDTALSSGNFTDLYLGDYWTKSVTIPDFYELTTAQPSNWTTNYTSYYTKSGNTYTAVTGSSAPTWAADTYYQKSVPAQTVTLKAVIADFDTFYGGYNSSYATINTHHAAVIVTGFNNVVWNKTNTTAGGYVNSLIHKWLVGSVLPEMETWFGSAKVISHQKLLTNAITGDAASGWAWSSQKIALLSENQMYGSKVWGGSKATNGGYEPGEAHKHLNVFNHIDANLLFGNKNIWLRDIASAVWAAVLYNGGCASSADASDTWIAPAALILLS